MTYSTYPKTKVYQRIDSVLLCHRETRMLVQSPSVLIRNTVAMLDIQCYDTHFVDVTARPVRAILREKIVTTYCTSRPSNKGTISSTNVFGVLPSAVTPVAQFCSTVAMAGSFARSKIAMHSCAMLR